MTLSELISVLEKHDPAKVVPLGFHNPHSYRGDYAQLAFEPKANTTVGAMLESARSALGATYQGWKGGYFEMGEHSACWLCEEGTSPGEGIGPVLLGYMVGELPEVD